MTKSKSFFPIGGPTSSLPRPIESFLSWSLCMSCLAVSGYHYCVSKCMIPFLRKFQNKQRKLILNRQSSDHKYHHEDDNIYSCNQNENNDDDNLKFLTNFIPLTIHSRTELESKTPLERYHQLMTIMTHLLSQSQKLRDINNIEDDKIIHLLRTNHICRHLASLAMRPYPITTTERTSAHANNNRACNVASNDTVSRTKRTIIEWFLSSILTIKLFENINTSMLLVDEPSLPLIRKIASLWPILLELPPLPSIPSSSSNGAEIYHISMIIPAYGENGKLLQTQLQNHFEKCDCPQHIEVIVVDANPTSNDSHSNELDKSNDLKSVIDDIVQKNKNQETIHSTTGKRWGDLRYVPFTQGGGRGPCMNYGAAVANGCILTFCHLDTKLPSHWDSKICDLLELQGRCQYYYPDKNHRSLAKKENGRANACAFSFGIDTSKQGLLTSFSSQDSGYYPPGIKAVETTANLRTHLYSLPYGDQVISVPTNIFKFIGGFPDQCLMEDYELVGLLRKRSALFDNLEYLKIISGQPALCSPRRWQKFGVLFVTYMNSKFVNLYAGGLSADDLYCKYYGRSPPKRYSRLSPWEIEMESLLQSQ